MFADLIPLDACGSAQSADRQLLTDLQASILCPLLNKQSSQALQPTSQTRPALSIVTPPGSWLDSAPPVPCRFTTQLINSFRRPWQTPLRHLPWQPDLHACRPPDPPQKPSLLPKAPRVHPCTGECYAALPTIHGCCSTCVSGRRSRGDLVSSCAGTRTLPVSKRAAETSQA